MFFSPVLLLFVCQSLAVIAYSLIHHQVQRATKILLQLQRDETKGFSVLRNITTKKYGVGTTSPTSCLLQQAQEEQSKHRAQTLELD